MTTWTLYDYGVGNLHSLRKSLDAVGAMTTVTADPAELVEADVAVLPGVGAFGHVMASLASAADGLRDRHAEGRPTFGVCIGLQALYGGSDESPDVPGLGILPGRVTRLPTSAGKIPHMGWNTLDGATGLLKGLDQEHVYYVHSYAAPVGRETFASTRYGAPFAAAIQAGPTLAFQFHPEKSSRVGHSILERTREHLEALA